ncbi:hypothetical protein PLICRDRAFT_169395 [Plicaturopsis crispa FD-325 SS-3]|nr:hypothetical protein PLICRDRAFT_169395 [Plicaturopsis crispa FD-325 SS-3]
MMKLLVNRPNRIIEKQRAFQASTKPIYYRGKFAPAIVNTYWVAYAGGLALTAYGAFNLVMGRKVEE